MTVPSYGISIPDVDVGDALATLPPAFEYEIPESTPAMIYL